MTSSELVDEREVSAPRAHSRTQDVVIAYPDEPPAASTPTNAAPRRVHPDAETRRRGHGRSTTPSPVGSTSAARRGRGGRRGVRVEPRGGVRRVAPALADARRRSRWRRSGRVPVRSGARRRPRFATLGDARSSPSAATAAMRAMPSADLVHTVVALRGGFARGHRAADGRARAPTTRAGGDAARPPVATDADGSANRWRTRNADVKHRSTRRLTFEVDRRRATIRGRRRAAPREARRACACGARAHACVPTACVHDAIASPPPGVAAPTWTRGDTRRFSRAARWRGRARSTEVPSRRLRVRRGRDRGGGARRRSTWPARRAPTTAASIAVHRQVEIAARDGPAGELAETMARLECVRGGDDDASLDELTRARSALAAAEEIRDVGDMKSSGVRRRAPLVAELEAERAPRATAAGRELQRRLARASPPPAAAVEGGGAFTARGTRRRDAEHAG